MEVLFFVPLGVNAEVHKVVLENRTEQERRIELYSLVEFCLWNALDDMTNFQRNFSLGEVEIEGSVIYHKTEYRERRNHFSFYSVNEQIVGFDSDRDGFLGAYNGFDAPQAVITGESGNSIAARWAPIASHHLSLRLAPGETKTVVFLLGYVENDPEEKWEAPGVIRKDQARKMIRRFGTAEAVEEAFCELSCYWQELLSRFHLESGDEKLNRMVNIWNQYQCLVTFNLARSAYHQYQPLTKRGNQSIGGDFNDDPLWLILAVSAYLKESGDWSVLEEQVPFDNYPDRTGSLFEHLRRSFAHVVNNRGPHALPLIGRADWNDCLNLNCFSTNPDESFQTTANKDGRVAESVLIAGMFVFIGREFEEICRRSGRTAVAEETREQVQAMEKAVLDHGWDGGWFLRAYDDTGSEIGSSTNEEGRIFIEAQGFCAMACIGMEKDYPRLALDAVKEHLDSDYGIVLVWPAYSHYYPNLGEISTYPRGYKENGGVFCHNNPWIMIAETLLGRGDRAFEYYRKICPAYLEKASELHKTEPYVYAQMIAGKEAVRPGEAKNSWLTGTAAWNFVAMSQWILGIRPEYDGLRIDPCVPPGWDGFTVRRMFRGTPYRIEVKNPQGVTKGVVSISLDGRLLEENLIPPMEDSTLHTVEVIMGLPESES